MTLTPQEWHQRFRQQVRWTQELRTHLLPRAGLAYAQRLLEIGCGTGALLEDMQTAFSGALFGLDIAAPHLGQAHRHAPHANLTQADAHYLPYPTGIFDLAVCHFLLLWVTDPAQTVSEMARVTRPGGAVLALAEPDYGGRIDYPEELSKIGAWQTAALQRQGADPFVGRRLATLLVGAGLQDVEAGVLGGRWTDPPSSAELALEWKVLQEDLIATPEAGQLPGLRALDEAAWARRERVLYVPTFYAIGWRVA
jgi:SAM-dependent methyltransferase